MRLAAKSPRQLGRPGRAALAVNAVMWGRHTGAASAARQQRRPDNVEGPIWVDATCIDCDTCRWMAPDVFSEAPDGMSAVHAQPVDRPARVRALQALLSCPTYSIHADQRDPQELREAQAGLPAPVAGTSAVYHNGWASERAIAAASWLITRPEGNVMVDSPRFSPVLAKQLERLGGVRYMFLTHKDDVGEHNKWAAHFLGMHRILHSLEVQSNTKDVEIKLEGEGPWRLPDGGDDVQLIFTPGHTSGHVCLFYAPDRALFTGDHLCQDYQDPQALHIFERFNWYSVPLQLENVRKLLDYDWVHLLPGHGRPMRLRDAAHRLQLVSSLLQTHGAVAAAAAP